MGDDNLPDHEQLIRDYSVSFATVAFSVFVSGGLAGHDKSTALMIANQNILIACALLFAIGFGFVYRLAKEFGPKEEKPFCLGPMWEFRQAYHKHGRWTNIGENGRPQLKIIKTA